MAAATTGESWLNLPTPLHEPVLRALKRAKFRRMTPVQVKRRAVYAPLPCHPALGSGR